MHGIDITALAIFASALAIAAAVPGPAVAAIVARVLARGTRGLAPFLLGIIISDVLWLTVAVSGLAVLAQTFQGVFIVIKYLGAAYLLWLAWHFWTAPATSIASAPLEVGEGGPAAFLGGLMVGLSNPKAMMFYLALLPGFIPLDAVTPVTFAELAAVTFAVLAVIFSAYVLAAARARRLFSSPRALAFINRATGTVMVGTAVAVATRS
ncbi:threonine/homoserine/homoserine lactone efflux protein [Pseudochelatococcus lubricantis]|uniref:Threonine/homoserine/homoserine lactone efflux protein n=1 Tax=Pseudochelatococcus lubricantis TaxID=1538102 RepID=A0ABX0UWE0_9HYPH|nr:threonine/homoserine/homoserine lactone efflux protein [Pseudochelatococcus lubricantis]